MIDAFVAQAKSSGEELTRQQAAIMIGQMAGYMSVQPGQEQKKSKTQPAPQTQTEKRPTREH